MYAHPNDKERLKKFPSQEFRMKKREEMHDIFMNSDTGGKDFSIIELISKGDLFNISEYTYMGKPMYTIDYIIATIKRETEIHNRYDKTMRDVAQMKRSHWFFGLFH